MEIAFKGTPGPVHLVLPFDVISADTSLEPIGTIAPMSKSGLSSAQKEMLVNSLNKAAKPIVITGPQSNQSRRPVEVAALSNALGMPIICLESARGLSDTYFGNFPEVLWESDLIILMGKRGDYATGLLTPGKISKDASVIAILTPEQPSPVHEEIPINILRVDTISMAIRDLASIVSSVNRDWACEIKRKISQRKPIEADGEKRHPAAVAESLQSFMEKVNKPILVADGGEFCQWIQARCNTNPRIINGLSGAIGGGICYAIGASIACPDATIFLTMGDGTAGFYLAEFNTAVRAGCSIVALIGNDFKWNAEVQIQIDCFGSDRVYACELDESANYAATTEGLGVNSTTINPGDNLDSALEQTLTHDGISCLNILIDSYPAPKFIPMKL